MARDQALDTEFLRKNDVTLTPFTGYNESTFCMAKVYFWPMAPKLFLIFALIQTAVAQSVDEVVVTATGLPRPLGEVGSSISVVTAQDIAVKQDDFAHQALARLAGFSFDQDGDVGFLRIRGFDRQYATILVDGVNIGDAADPQGAAELAHLFTEDIARIEVLRGSQSVLYGSNAIAGTVNIMTQRAQEGLEGQWKLESGSERSRRSSFSLSGGAGPVSGRVSLGALDKEPKSEFKFGSENEDHEALTLSGRLDIAASDTVSVAMVGRYLKAATDHDGYDPDTYAPVDGWFGTDTQAASGHVAVTSLLGDGRLELTIRAGLSQRRRDSYEQIGPHYWYDGERSTVSVTGKAMVTSELGLFFGHERQREEFAQAGLAQKELDHEASFIMGQVDITPNAHASLGLRRDDHEKFGSHDSWRFALAYHFQPNIILRAARGTGFRAPSLYELFGEDPFCLGGLCGNQALEPEKSVSSDVGLEWSTPHAKLGLNLYRIAINNRIEYVGPPPSFLGNYQNVMGKSMSEGLEVSGALNWWGWRLAANISYTDPRNADGTIRNKQPRQLLNFEADHDFADGKGSFGMSWRHVGHRYIYGTRQEDYGLAQLRLKWRFRENITALLRAENILDDDYEVATGKSTPGRSIFLGLTGVF